VEWASDDPYARRRELYARAAPVFRRNGYWDTTLKDLAGACGLSIPALYRYFPSKRAFAFFPLASLYPELQAPPPNVSDADPVTLLSGWIDAAVTELPNYTLALRLAHEAGLTEDEERTVETNLAAHIAVLSAIAQRAAPHLDGRSADELASTMISVAVGPAAMGLVADPVALRRQLRALLRGYGLVVGRTAPADTRR
jgi:AcrR family transcriptional regulator